MRQITNLIQKSINDGVVSLGQVPVDQIRPQDNFANRVGLTADNYKHNQDFVDLMDNIKSNGQQEPIHIVQQGDHFVCVAGNRRTLALQLLSSDAEILNATAYIWAEGTDERTLFQLSTFTNAQRKDLSMVEKANMLSAYKELNQDATNAKINRDLSLGPNDAYVVDDFASFYTECQSFVGDENNAHQYPERFNVVQDIIEFVNADQLKQNMYMKIVQLTKKEQATVKQLGQDEFEIKVQLFKLLMDGTYTTLKKKGIKEAFIKGLKQVSDEDIANAPELNIDDSVEEADRVEAELKRAEALEHVSREEVEMFEASESSGDSVTLPSDIASKALKLIYDGMVLIDQHDLRKLILSDATELNLVKKNFDNEDHHYSGATEFFTKFGKLFNKTLKRKANAPDTYINDLVTLCKDYDKQIEAEQKQAEAEAQKQKLALQTAKETLAEVKKTAKAEAKEARKTGKENAKGVAKDAKNAKEKKAKAIAKGEQKAGKILEKAGIKIHKLFVNAGSTPEEATAIIEKAGLVNTYVEPEVEASEAGTESTTEAQAETV